MLVIKITSGAGCLFLRTRGDEVAQCSSAGREERWLSFYPGAEWTGSGSRKIPESGREPMARAGSTRCELSQPGKVHLIQVILQDAAGLWVAQFADRPLFDLADTFARHFQLFTDLFQGMIVIVEQTEA